ncbi:MAG TPA: DNA-processing protein DprA [Longimicrobiaceae bacterium]|nr:DNA-processing protein DprA [Longimicrobiaceae bacterium]
MADPDLCIRLERGSVGYPEALERLGAAAPAVLTLRGAARLLRLPLVGLFCSVHAPGGAVLAVYDSTRALRDAGTPVIGGFQSPLERECLEFLLRGPAPVVVCPARSIETMRLPDHFRRAIAEDRLLLLSPFPARRRPDAAMAALRNRVVAALAARVLFLHASRGGRLRALAAETLARGTPTFCLDLPENDELRVLGAMPHLPA